MAKNKIKAPGFDEIVFEFRNKEYGAYVIRKKYNKYMTISLLIGIFVVCTALITPYYIAKTAFERGEAREERMVELTMENLEMPSGEDFAAPPPPPPPPPEDAVQQSRYVPPVIVDSVKPEEEVRFMTFDEIREEVVDRAVDEVIEVVTTVATVEITNVEDEIPEFVVVEEMPSYPGGDAALLSYIANAMVYPERAKENNIQGRVYLQFVVTSAGTIGQVNVLRGVDPELDAEAIRVIRTITGFRPGRQGGVAVPVWYQVPINFQLR